MRLVGWQVQPVILADNGEFLTPVGVQSQVVPAASWQAFKDGGDVAALEQIRCQIEVEEITVDDLQAVLSDES